MYGKCCFRNEVATASPTDLAIDGCAFINGERFNVREGQTFDCISAVDGRVLTRVADINTAAVTGLTAFDNRRRSGMSPAARERVMIRSADQLLDHADELALMQTLDRENLSNMRARLISTVLPGVFAAQVTDWEMQRYASLF